MRDKTLKSQSKFLHIKEVHEIFAFFTDVSLLMQQK